MTQDQPDMASDSAVPVKFSVAPNPNVPIKVLWGDDAVLVLYKPAGVVVQPGLGHTRDTILNGLFAQYGKFLQNLGVKRDYGLLHRLDKDTSGIMMVALRPKAYDLLREDFEQRRIDKTYATFVAGVPKTAQGVIQARLKEVQAGGIKKVIISTTGQEAISAYKVVNTTKSKSAALVDVNIKTGRLHQVRAHMLFLGTPVLGDYIYSLPAVRGIPVAPRLCLHAVKLGFKHPLLKKWQEHTCPFPPDMASYATKLGLVVPSAYLVSEI